MSLKGTVWAPIGPSPLHAGIDVNGQVTSIAVNPNNPNVIYIGTAWGGVWRTHDGGKTWKPIVVPHGDVRLVVYNSKAKVFHYVLDETAQRARRGHGSRPHRTSRHPGIRQHSPGRLSQRTPPHR